MYIKNIHDFPNLQFYKCNFDTYIYLLKAGFTPVFIDKGFYFFILDEKIKSVIKIGGEDCKI